MSETRPILAKINVSKIQKERLFKGERGTYLDCALVPSTNNQYGDDFVIVQSVSKEERLAGVKGPIIGNAKFVVKKGQNNPAPKSEDGDGLGDDTTPPF